MIFTEREHRIFNTLAARILPRTEGLPLGGADLDFTPAIERYFAVVEAPLRKHLKRALMLFNRGAHLSRMTHRSFTRLDPAEQDKYIKAWEESSFYPRRAIFTALKTVVILIYSSLPEVEKAVGYSPTW